MKSALEQSPPELASDIAYARDAFRDLLAIRASSTLFRLSSAEDIKQRLRFHNTGPAQTPTVIVAHLVDVDHIGDRFEVGARVAGAVQVREMRCATAA